MDLGKQKRLVVWLTIVGVGLAACARPEGTQSTPSSTEQVTTEITVVSTTLPASTLALAQPREATTPTPETRLTATPTPLLAVKEPSAGQLSAYLRVKPDNVKTSDKNGDGKADLIIFETIFQPGIWQTWVWYEDVNGDNDIDLIVFEEPYVWIWIWDRDRYVDAYRSEQLQSWASINLRILFEDWTKDEQPEIVVDYQSLAHTNSATWATYWERKIIWCQATKCEQVWGSILAGHYEDAFWRGVSLYQASMRTTTDQKGRPAIRTLTTDFALYCCDYLSAPLNIFTSTVSVYSWNGSAFELTDSQVASVARTVESHSSLVAISNVGVSSTVSAIQEDDNPLNKVCQLYVADQAAGQLFDCIPNFTTVTWQDITNDGQDEIMVLALAAPHEPNGADSETAAQCMHQHLLAYQWEEDHATKIADIVGCVVREDLYGVRPQDFDNDGQLDIVAAEPLFRRLVDCIGNCWQDVSHRTQIYKWDGANFIFWDEVSAP